jgi:hypothetical protein
MSLVTDVLNRVARQVSIQIPDSWLSATATEYAEIRDDFLQETVRDIAERLDLPSPIARTFTLNGTGSETYNLPADFMRLQRDQLAVYETTTVRRAMTPITTDGAWSHIKEIGSTGAERFYKVEGYEGNFTISIYREPAASIEVKIHYITRNWMATAAGVAGYAFTAPTDVLLMPRRVVELGTVMRWRARKGLPSEDVATDYEIEISRLSNDARGRRAVHFGDPHIDLRPWDVPVPDFIPGA